MEMSAGPTSFCSSDDCHKDYLLGAELGSGAFAIVRKGICRSDGSEWAVKCFTKSSMSGEDVESLHTEAAILSKICHPNVVTMRKLYDCPRTYYMVLELMTGGELFDRVVEKSKYSEAEAAADIVKIADAIAHCHANGIVHRDLKPENLLYKDTTDSAEVKIADFGLAKARRGTETMLTPCGTPGYVAPEVLFNKPYTEKVDCWSLGVILYILLCGFPPFYDENNATLFEQIKAGAYDFPSPYWDDVSEGAKDLVKKLLVVDPAGRLSAKDVLAHPWVRSAPSNPLDIGERLKKFNAKRRFRQGVRKVQALAKFGKLGGKSLAESLQTMSLVDGAAPDEPSIGGAGAVK